MKYLKTYEDKVIKQFYWLIPTDYRYLDSLNKIISDDSIVSKFLGFDNIRKYLYAFIIYDNKTFSNKDHDFWYYSRFEGSLSPEWLKGQPYEFKGMVNLEPDEIEKIYLEDSANKYNL